MPSMRPPRTKSFASSPPAASFRTALLISHRKSTLAACSDGIVLRDGAVVEAGPLQGLRYFRDMTGQPRPKMPPEPRAARLSSAN